MKQFFRAFQHFGSRGMFLMPLLLATGIDAAVNPRFAFVGTGGNAFSQKFGLPYYALEGNYHPSTGTFFSSVHPDNDPRPGFKVLRKVAKLNVRTDGLGQTNPQFQTAFESHAQNLIAWYNVNGSRPPKPLFTWYSPNADALAAAESLQIVNTIRREKLANPAVTGTVWEIGNEPNFFPAILPAEYAAIYANYHRIIKREDSTAKIAFGALFTRETGDDLKPMTRELIVAKLTQQGALALLGQPRFDSLVADIDSTLFSRLFNLGSAAYVSQAFAALPSNVRPDYISLHVYPFDDRPPVQTKSNIQNRIDSLIAALAPITGSKPVWITEFGNVNPALSVSAVTTAMSDLIDVLTGNSGIGNIFYYKATGADQQLDLLSGLGAAAAGAPLTRLANDSAFSPLTGNFACSQLNAIGHMYYLRAVGTSCQDVAPATAPVLISPALFATGLPVTTSLSWNPVIGAASYRVQVATSADFLSPVVNDTAYIGTGRGIGPLSGGTSYYWRVRARNGFGESPWSEIFVFTTVPVPPVAPTPLSPAQFASDVSVAAILSWSPSGGGGAVTYRVQVATAPDFAVPLLDDSTVTEVSRSAGLLAGNTAYYWRVRAKNGSGVSEWSVIRLFTTGILPLPAPPTLVSPAPFAVFPFFTPVQMRWGSVLYAATYQVQVSGNSGFTTFQLNDSIFTDTLSPLFLFSGPVNFWRVRAINATGSSDWSETQSFTIENEVALRPGHQGAFASNIDGRGVLHFRLARAEHVRVTLYDLNGVRLFTFDRRMEAGPGAVRLPLSDRGDVRIVDISIGGTRETLKLHP